MRGPGWNGERSQGVWHDLASGAEYSGQWQAGQPHGEGTYLVPGVLRYTGAWIQVH